MSIYDLEIVKCPSAPRTKMKISKMFLNLLGKSSFVITTFLLATGRVGGEFYFFVPG